MKCHSVGSDYSDLSYDAMQCRARKLNKKECYIQFQGI